MMTDENTPDAASSHPEDSADLKSKKGQMLVIYLPEGSVIVDRTDIDLSSAPGAVIEHVVAKPEPVAAPIAQADPQPLQSTLQEVVQLAVQEVLQITGQAPSQAQNEPVTPPVTASTPRSEIPAHAYVPRTHVRRRRRLNWVHGINTLFVAYLLLVAIVPGILSSAFGMAIYASKSAHPGVLIAKGDLMVCKELPSSKLKVNDVLLVRDGNSWHLDARQVTSNTSDGTLSTITTASTGGSSIDKTYVLASDSSSYKVTRVIPKLGFVPIVLSSTIVKVLGGLAILVLNLVVHYRRARRRRAELAIR